jgi:hypothetical protein
MHITTDAKQATFSKQKTYRYAMFWVFTGVVLLFFPACGREQAPLSARDVGTQIGFETVYGGAGPAPGGDGRNVARLLCDRRRADRLLRAWQLRAAGPHVDSVRFSQSCLVAVRGTSQPDTGPRIHVVSIERRRGHAVVTATVNDRTGATGMAISRPYSLLEINRSQASRVVGPIAVRIR